MRILLKVSRFESSKTEKLYSDICNTTCVRIIMIDVITDQYDLLSSALVNFVGGLFPDGLEPMT